MRLTYWIGVFALGLALLGGIRIGLDLGNAEARAVCERRMALLKANP